MRASLEDPDSAYGFGYSCGREALEDGRPDSNKVSYYANPVHNSVTTRADLRHQYPSYCRCCSLQLVLALHDHAGRMYAAVCAVCIVDASLSVESAAGCVMCASLFDTMHASLNLHIDISWLMMHLLLLGCEAAFVSTGAAEDIAQLCRPSQQLMRMCAETTYGQASIYQLWKEPSCAWVSSSLMLACSLQS